MSITDELRECIATAVWQYENDVKTAYIPKDKLTAIAERIDAAHAKAVERARMDGMDETFGNGWVKLPVDADGVPIHVGDTIEIDHNGRVTQVDCVTCWEESWMVCCSEGGMFDPKKTRCHHVQPDSWERIIEDAIDTAFEGVDDESEFDLKKMELVDRCRRLAGAE